MSTPITPSTLSDSLLIIDYETPEQFYLCLSYLVLQNSLARVLEQPLTMEYLQMVKKKLQEVMDEAEQGPLLGPWLARVGPGSGRCWEQEVLTGGLVFGVMPLCAPQSTKEFGGWGLRGQDREAAGWGNRWGNERGEECVAESRRVAVWWKQGFLSAR